MVIKYLATYRDEFGEETVAIENDGKTLSLVLRGVKFIGKNFHSFVILDNVFSPENHNFNLCLGELCSYSIDCDIPVRFVSNDGDSTTHLHVHIEYGMFDELNKINHEVLHFMLEHDGQVYQSDGKNLYSTFDEQLTTLQDVLPKDVYLKACWSCSFSDYDIAGSGMFGDMACFRNTKNEYLQVKNKVELTKLWDQRAEDVQEIYLCSEFEKRQPGVGGQYVGHGNMQKSG